MRHIVIVIIFVAAFTVHGRAEQINYISPGIEVSWNLHGDFIFSPKVSVGVFNNGTFFNFTIGRSSSSDEKTYPHYYFEIQSGVLSKRIDPVRAQLFFGAGVGIVVFEKRGIAPRLSLFTGNLLFIDATVLFLEKVETDIGAQIVFPIPLQRIEFGRIGG